MIEVKGDLWTSEADIIVITTNGSIKKNGCAVLGRGVAAQAKAKFPRLPRALGALLKRSGNHVHYLGGFQGTLHRLPQGLIISHHTMIDVPIHLIAFPVKHEWHLLASLDLIQRSAIELNYLCHIILPGAGVKTSVIALPRPGCGNGGLEWDVVKPVLEKVGLDDRYVVVERKET